jgi:hypothetical protein
MAGNRESAAVEEVNDCSIAQHAKVEAEIGFIVLTRFADWAALELPASRRAVLRPASLT